MRKLAAVSLGLFVAGVLAGAVAAGDKTVTLEGKVVCAKCNLKQKEFDQCQNVLIAEQDGKTTHYYLTKNDAYREFGDVCLATKHVRVTGSLSEKDGRIWLAATEIVLLKGEG